MRRLACLLIVYLVASAVRADQPFDIVPDVVYGHKDGMALTFDVFRPKQGANRAAVLFMVSGGWYSRYTPPEQSAILFSHLVGQGYTVFAVRHGSSPRYVIPEIIEDVRRAVRFVRLHAGDYNVDPQRLGVMGGSAGGHLSLVLGTMGDDGNPGDADEVLRTSDRVAAVVAYYPPTDLRPWTEPSSKYYQTFPALRFDMAKFGDCSPLLHVSADDAPTLLVHGDQDTLVPLDHSERILAQLKEHQVPCELLVIPGAGHSFKGQDALRANAATLAWLKKHLLQ